jgi:hypothetical protein
MNSTSLATHGVGGSALIVVLWVAQHYGIVPPDYVVAALGVLVGAAGHTAVSVISAYLARKGAPAGVLADALKAVQAPSA